MAQALDQTFHHRIGHGTVFGQAACEIDPGQLQHIGLDLGLHRGRMRLVVDKTHFPDVVTGMQDGQDHLLARAIPRDDAGPTREHDEQRIAFLVLFDDVLSFAIASLDDRLRDCPGLRVGQHREQGNPADQLEIGQDDHGKNLGCGELLSASYNAD